MKIRKIAKRQSQLSSSYWNFMADAVDWYLDDVCGSDSLIARTVRGSLDGVPDSGAEFKGGGDRS